MKARFTMKSESAYPVKNMATSDAVERLEEEKVSGDAKNIHQKAFSLPLYTVRCDMTEIRPLKPGHLFAVQLSEVTCNIPLQSLHFFSFLSL